MTPSSTADLQRLIYRSRPDTSRLRADLDAILPVSIWANARHRITGVLAYSEGAYVQVLEGPGRQLDTLLDCLTRDTRHVDLRISDRCPVEDRLFPGWSMARAPLPPDALAELERNDRAALISRLKMMFEQDETRVA